MDSIENDGVIDTAKEEAPRDGSPCPSFSNVEEMTTRKRRSQTVFSGEVDTSQRVNGSSIASYQDFECGLLQADMFTCGGMSSFEGDDVTSHLERLIQVLSINGSKESGSVDSTLEYSRTTAATTMKDSELEKNVDQLWKQLEAFTLSGQGRHSNKECGPFPVVLASDDENAETKHTPLKKWSRGLLFAPERASTPDKDPPHPIMQGRISRKRVHDDLEEPIADCQVQDDTDFEVSNILGGQQLMPVRAGFQGRPQAHCGRPSTPFPEVSSNVRAPKVRKTLASEIFGSEDELASTEAISGETSKPKTYVNGFSKYFLLNQEVLNIEASPGRRRKSDGDGPEVANAVVMPRILKRRADEISESPPDFTISAAVRRSLFLRNGRTSAFTCAEKRKKLDEPVDDVTAQRRAPNLGREAVIQLGVKAVLQKSQELSGGSVDSLESEDGKESPQPDKIEATSEEETNEDPEH